MLSAPQDAAVPPSLRERYHATLGYVHATLEQQTALLEQHQHAEAEWKAEREVLQDSTQVSTMSARRPASGDTTYVLTYLLA